MKIRIIILSLLAFISMQLISYGDLVTFTGSSARTSSIIAGNN